MFKKSKCLFFQIFLFLSFLVNSCNRSSSVSFIPQERLKEYISKSFSIHSIEGRSQLVPYLTGEVKARLESWSPEQFKEAFIDSKREFGKLNILDSHVVSPTELQITYELSYREESLAADQSNHQVKIKNKKMCRMILENGIWMISQVKNIKELIEYQDELSLP